MAYIGLYLLQYDSFLSHGGSQVTLGSRWFHYEYLVIQDFDGARGYHHGLDTSRMWQIEYSTTMWGLFIQPTEILKLLFWDGLLLGFPHQEYKGRHRYAETGNLRQKNGAIL